MHSRVLSVRSLSFLLIVAVVLSCFCVLPVQAEAPWLSGWGKRELFYWQGGAPLNASLGVQGNLTVLNQTGFNSGVTFNIYNETLPTFEDLRVTSSDGLTTLPVWNQTTNYGVNCTFWVKFPAVNASYWLYWNNLNASSVWNQSAVFIDVISGVVGAWNMEETSGSVVADSSGKGNNGTATGTTIVASLFPGKMSRNFNNSANIITITQASVLNIGVNGSSYSVVMWVNPVSAQVAIGRLLTTDSVPYPFTVFCAGSPATIYSAIYDGTHNPITASASAVGWQHYALVRNASSKVLTQYINSSAYAIEDTTLGNLNVSSPFYLGNRILADRPALVSMGLVSFFNCALSAAQVANLSYQYGYPDVGVVVGSVFVRNYVSPSPVVSNFGVVESAPVVPTPSPTVDPDAVTAEDALGVGVAFGLVAVGVCAALVLVAKRRQD